MQSKKPWQSKTNWIALIIAGLAFVPKLQDFVAAYPQAVPQVLAAVFVILRQISHGKIEIS